MEKPNFIRIDEIIEKSSQFSVKIPQQAFAVKCEFLRNKYPDQLIERNINSAYPLISEQTLKLLENFLRKNAENPLYASMTVPSLVDRLLKKRAISFFGSYDFYMFSVFDENSEDFRKVFKRNEDGLKQDWETVGTSNETYPLIKDHCLTYEEIELSALLCVSSETIFINRGDRANNAHYLDNRTEIQETGVILGAVGPRFERPNVMDHKRMVTSVDKAYPIATVADTVMEEFYGDATNDTYLKVGNTYLNLDRYKKRLLVTFDAILIDANARAMAANKTAFIHIVGLGLGYWKLASEQNTIYVNTFLERLKCLAGNLKSVSDVRFAYIRDAPSVGGTKVDHIQIHCENVDPHGRIGHGKLLLVTFAWDGNAAPGNEFWVGSFSESSDSAAGCSTQVAELHNAHVNRRVSGGNLRVASVEWGLVPLEEYYQRKLGKSK